MPPDRPSFVACAGRDAAPDAAAYSFSRPRAVSTRHMRALDAAHERLAAELSATFALALGEPVGVRVLSTDEVLIADFVNSRQTPAALFRMRLGPGGPALAVDLSPNWGAFLVQRHFGGQDALAPDAAARATSALERSVLERRWLPLIGVAFADAWGSLPPVADAFASDPAAFDLGPLPAPVVVLELEATVGDETARVTVAYPAATVHTLLGGAALSAARRAVGAPDGANITALAGLPVDLRVVLGRASIPLGDLMGLQPGDVVSLGCATRRGAHRVIRPARPLRGACRRAGAPPRHRDHVRLRLFSRSMTDFAPPTDLDDAPTDLHDAPSDAVAPPETPRASVPHVSAPHASVPCSPASPAALASLSDVEIEIMVELGRRRLSIAELSQLGVGSVVELDTLAGEPVTVFANGRRIATGDVVVLDGQLGVQVTALEGRAS